MDDLISRQDAVMHFVKASKNYECGMFNLAEVTHELWEIASAQPTERCIATITLTDEQVREAFEEAKRKILAEQPEQRWIPCSERLPEKGLRVLMYLNNAWQIVGWYDKEDKQWYALPLSQEVVNDCVLAWMPLPEDYEESEE